MANINLDIPYQSDIDFDYICDENSNSYFFRYIRQNLRFNKEDVVIVYLNIILHEDLNAFKFMNFYFPYNCYHDVEIKTSEEDLWNSLNNSNYTYSAHCFSFSQRLTRYALKHMDLPIYNIVSKMIHNDMYVVLNIIL